MYLANLIMPVKYDGRGVTAVEYLTATYDKDHLKLYEIFRNIAPGTYDKAGNAIKTSDPLYAVGRVLIDNWIATQHPEYLDREEGTPMNDQLMVKAIKELTK